MSDDEKTTLSVDEVKEHISTYMNQREEQRNNNPDMTPEAAELQRQEDLEGLAQYGEAYDLYAKERAFDDWKVNGERYMQELAELQTELTSLEQSEAPDRERIEELQLSIMQQESHINDMNEVADQEQREAFYQSEYGMSAREYDLSQQAAKIEQSIEQTPDIDHDYTPDR